MAAEASIVRTNRVMALTNRSDDGPLHIHPLSSPQAVRAEWETLAAANGNIFTTVEWASAWLEHFRGDASPLLAACRRRDGSIAGILPLVVRREGRLRVIRLLGHGPADRLAPVCAPADRRIVARALRGFLADSGCDLFIGEQMPANEGWSESLGATVLERESSPALGIDGLEWEQFLAGRSSNFRGQVRRREKRLAERGELRFRLTDDPGELSADLETLFRLHDARWQSGGASAFVGRARDLHRDFASDALERGWLRLWLLELDDRPLAAWYGFRYGGAEWYYQSGRDPAADADGVGFVLFCHTIREAMNDGMREYRLLRGDEAYKARFADRDPGLASVALGLTPLGRAALLVRRARPSVRKAVGRLHASRKSSSGGHPAGAR